MVALLSKVASNVVFQPSHINAYGPSVLSFLLGNTSGIKLVLKTVTPSNLTGVLPAPSCMEKQTNWSLTQESVSKTALRVQLGLNRSLTLCSGNETGGDCCPQPLCVLEILRVTACREGVPQASLLISVKIYARLLPTGPVSNNKTVIPNQVFHPLGSCPCDMTEGDCDIRCCCDTDCSAETRELFKAQCFKGPFGGATSPPPDYQCSVQSAANAPDWFPFLCVTSTPDNNPGLGLFYQGLTITPEPSPSFQRPVQTPPRPMSDYRQGDPILTRNNQFLTISQKSLTGQCVKNAPVAFLENVKAQCATRLVSCPATPPFQTLPDDLSLQVKDGRGGVITVEVTDLLFTGLNSSVISPDPKQMSAGKEGGEVCVNVTLALDYKFFWQGNGLTNITLTRTVGTFPLNNSVVLTTNYSTVFLNGDPIVINSGNPGYQVGRPVIGGSLTTSENNTGAMQRTFINLWRPVSAGLCDSAEMRPALFGENSTAGCLVAVTRQNLSQCDLLRETVASLQANLVKATHVARSGNPDSLNLSDWVNVTFLTPNREQPSESTNGSCSGILSYLHIHVRSSVSDVVEGVPQEEIYALEVSFTESTWRLACGGGDPAVCLYPDVSQTFPLTSAITFTSLLVSTGPPKTRFQINFTEYDCDRNDVCWPELAFPLTRYYSGEPYSQSLAKGFILVFFFIASCILGTPWKQIRQAWKSASM